MTRGQRRRDQEARGGFGFLTAEKTVGMIKLESLEQRSM